jgi:Icc protein
LLAHVSELHLDGSEHTTSRARKVVSYLSRFKTDLDVVVVTGDIEEHGLVFPPFR